jgi:DNA-binding PadR family transcriptional regulator
LVKHGLVEFEQLDARAGPPRRVHTITAAGRAELSGWVTQDPQPRPMNDELVVKAYALRRAHNEAARTLLREQIEIHEQRVGVLEQLALALESRGAATPSSPRFGEYAAVRRGVGAERDYLSWSRWLLEKLTSSRSPKSGRPRAGGTRVRRSVERRTR